MSDLYADEDFSPELYLALNVRGGSVAVTFGL
jgi:hypothetical protein